MIEIEALALVLDGGEDDVGMETVERDGSVFDVGVLDDVEQALTDAVEEGESEVFLVWFGLGGGLEFYV